MSAIRQIRGAARTFSFATLLIAQIAPALAEEACRLVTIGTATVRAATADGIALYDGRVVRLAGIELGAAPDLAGGTAVTLKRLGTEADRYGRLQAHVFIDDNGAESWLQAGLVARGMARVSSRVGDPGCAKLLLANENSARAARLGLWAEPVYVIGKAEDPEGVLQSRGRFALVEGKVVSVRESGGTIYVNFGRRWSALHRHHRQTQRARLRGRRSRAEVVERPAGTNSRVDRGAGRALGGGGTSRADRGTQQLTGRKL